MARRFPRHFPPFCSLELASEHDDIVLHRDSTSMLIRTISQPPRNLMSRPPTGFHRVAVYDRQDFEDATRGFIATTPTRAIQIAGHFLKHEASPDSKSKSLASRTQRHKRSCLRVN